MFIAIRLTGDPVNFSNVLLNQGVPSDGIIVSEVDKTTLKTLVTTRIQLHPGEQWMTFSSDQLGQVKSADLPAVKFDPVT